MNPIIWERCGGINTAHRSSSPIIETNHEKSQKF